MSLVHASRRTVLCNPALGRSYAEISQFVRTRHHGITLRTAGPTCLHNARMIHSAAETTRIEPDEKLRKVLDGYKEILDSTPWDTTKIHLAQFTGSLNKGTIGTEVALEGYITTRRNVNKNLSFAVIRNSTQQMSIQLVSTANVEGSSAAEAHARLKTIREWTPVIIKGILQERVVPKGREERLGTSTKDSLREADKREIALTYVLPLNEIPSDVIVKEGAAYGPEQRHLQLRLTPKLRENIMLRHRVTTKARGFLSERGMKDIETPLLFKSTPEGAREFLVPTRNKGLAYALPQSPQQYKQILMASGYDKYFQFAKCFRDEDLRADRQPEFTQLDIEMSFAGEDQVMSMIEDLVTDLWHKELEFKLRPFTRMIYQDAMKYYGSDKPDLRWTPRIYPITHLASQDFVSKVTSLEDPIIDAFKFHPSPEPAVNRKFITDFFDSSEGKPYLNNPDGQPAIFFGDASQPLGGLGPLGHRFAMECPPEVSIDHGDILVIQARPNAPFQGQGSTMLGNLRSALHKAARAQGLGTRPVFRYEFLWVTDFPLFTPSVPGEGQGGLSGLSSTHHPFTAPKTSADVELLLSDPMKSVAAHYDLVVNGVELGGGSRRIHSAGLQEFIFRDILQMKSERIEDFRHLLNVLKSGCPPHAGIALGWDRLCAVMCRTESVRDVIAFPKTGSGEDPLVKAPVRVSGDQWSVYGLKVEE